MPKKLKLLYIDPNKIVRKFFELTLKDSSVDLLTLEELSTFKHNYEEFGPELTLVDRDAISCATTENYEYLIGEVKKLPAKFAICGKIDQMQIDTSNFVKYFSKRLSKPYSPAGLEEQIRALLGQDKVLH